MYAFITPKNVYERWDDSKKYTDELTRPFPEFQRIARNRSFEDADPAYPDVTDGTTASIVQKTPKRIVQQLPTGKVVTDDEGWLGIVADFIYSHKIIPYANEDYNLLEKSHLVIEGGLTFGSTCSFAPFLNHDGYFCPDMTLPYWGDIYLQRGKKSGRSCSYVFIRSWWQPADIKALIKSENQLAAQARKRGAKYQATWDTGALKEVLDAQTAKDKQGRTPSENERNNEVEGIQLVTAFQKGVGASFLTFNPEKKKIVRTKKNKDPRGKMPIDWFFGDIDGTNPLGRGVVELLGGLQNLIDSDMQAYQYNRALALQPPVVKYGNIGNFTFAPNEVVDASTDPNAKIVPLVIDTTAIVNYPALYGLQKSQLLNLVNSPDSSISADVGNPNFSKTTAGVQQQQAAISVDDNAILKRFENWFESWSETALNTYFAERTGKEMLQLDKETAMRLRELEGFDQKLLNDQNQILINYDTATPILKFRVNPGTTGVKDSAAQVQDATNLLDMVMKYPMLNAAFGGPIDTDILARRIVVNSGIDDPEQVAPEPTAAQKKAKEQAKNSTSPFSPMFDKPSIRIAYSDLPPAAQVQLLANAGVQVGMQDVLQGPVVDPNMRGVMNPVDDPNVLLPGVQPGQPAIQSTPSQAPVANAAMTQQPPLPNQVITPDHILKANQQVHQQQMDKAKLALEIHKAVQPPQLPQAPQSTQPTQQPKPQTAQQPQLSAQDQQIILQLHHLGLPQQLISEALALLNQGATPEQVLQHLGVAPPAQQAQGAPSGRV